MRGRAQRTDAKQLPSFQTARVSTDNHRLEHIPNYLQHNKRQPVRELASTRRQFHCSWKWRKGLFHWREDGDPFHDRCDQQLLVMSLAVTLDKIMDSDGAYATDEIISILYEQYFSLYVFRNKVKCHQYCLAITPNMIQRCKDS